MRTDTLTEQMMRVGHPHLFGWGIVALRIALGVAFLNAGLAKFGDWSAEAYLQAASGPFATWFMSLAGNPVVDALNSWGLTLIGLSLILGLAVRPAAFVGMLLMVLYYFAHFTTNTAQGYIDQHVIYLLLFAVFTTGGVGHVFGLNGFLLRSLRRPGVVIRFLFG